MACLLSKISFIRKIHRFFLQIIFRKKTEVEYRQNPVVQY